MALFRAWQTTVQSGMGAWQEMTKYNGANPKSKRQLQKEEAFLNTWSFGNLFCSRRKGVSWNLVPHPEFLSKNLANRYKRFREEQPRPCSPAAEPEASQSSPVFSQATGTALPVSSPQSEEERNIQRNAEDILDRILQEIALEVNEEDATLIDSSQ